MSKAKKCLSTGRKRRCSGGDGMRRGNCGSGGMRSGEMLINSPGELWRAFTSKAYPGRSDGIDVDIYIW
ncbi:hypothetical protein J7M23_07455 [Candidatus Sumerlaeota bacterium]|nr:hypothetical protein [Candidatus Sumerlaeota bacterium]